MPSRESADLFALDLVGVAEMEPSETGLASSAGGSTPALVETGPGVRPADPDVLPTIPLMGLDFAVVSEAETVAHVIGQLGRGRGGWVCTVNLDILRHWRRSAEMRELIDGSDMVVADGMPIVWASAVRGTPLPERVAGSTLVVTLTAAAAKAGASVFLIGGNPGTAKAAGAKFLEESPELQLGGTLCPPFGFEQQPELMDEIERELLAARPDIVYVGLGSPKQEKLIRRLRPLLPNAWFIGCGVSFSFVAGEFVRAPTAFQRLGLEWVVRLVQEPGRLWRRYLVSGLPFMVELMSASIADRRRATLQLEPPRP